MQDNVLGDDLGSEAKKHLNKKINILDEGQLERLIYIYLKRWGVIARSLLEKESLSPPWRELLIQLRKMELQGILRGGRFIAGLSGEQFSLPDTVDEIRKFKRVVDAKERKSFFCLSATDPLNLINLTSGDQKLTRLQKNRVLYHGGSPVAFLESGRVRNLKEIDSVSSWEILQMLTNKNFRFRQPNNSQASIKFVPI